MAKKNDIASFMRKHIEEYRDSKTGELNHTLMAEQAAAEFNLYEEDDEYTIPEFVFELAIRFN